MLTSEIHCKLSLTSILIFYLFMKKTNGKANLRRYSEDTQTCECIFATDDFRDSQTVAPQLETQFLLVNVAPCDIRVTFEHSHQISRIKTSASSSETCQRDALKSSFSAVYCPDSSFCGQDIDPQKTGQLKFLSKKHCAVFHLNLSLCAKLQANLDNADVNECLFNNGTCGDYAGTCTNVRNQGYDCSCIDGYKKSIISERGIVTCADVNECDFLCLGNFETCENSIGNFSCKCKEGFFRDKTSNECVDINECQYWCSSDAAKCQNSIGSFNCTCESGFIYNWTSNNCHDFDECTERAYDCSVSPNIFCLNYPGGYICVPSSLQTMDVFKYMTEGYAPLTYCNASINTYCSCHAHYMVATYNGTTFCMNTFFLPGGDTTLFPVCDAPCCSEDCDLIQAVDGFTSSNRAEYPVTNLWDRDLSTLHHSMHTVPQPTVYMDLGSEFVINSISVLNRVDRCANDICTRRLKDVKALVCHSSNGDNCTTCGDFLKANNQWNSVRCNTGIVGSWVHLKSITSNITNLREVIIHYDKNN